MNSDFYQKRRIDRSVQFNCRLRYSAIELVRSGCSHTGLSQGKFVELCIMAQAGRIPGVLKRLEAAALEIVSSELAGVKPPS